MVRSSGVLNLLENYGYAVRMTDPEASHQIYTAEIPHGYIVQEVQSLTKLNDASLKIFTYALSC